MSNFDDIFAGQNNGSQWRDKPFNKEEWAAKKQEERKEIYELADTTAVEISKDGEKFQKYLDVQARFDRYSPTNALLIYAQMRPSRYRTLISHKHHSPTGYLPMGLFPQSRKRSVISRSQPPRQI